MADQSFTHQGISRLLRAMHDIQLENINIQERFDRLTEATAAHLVADVCSIFLRKSNDDLELCSAYGLEPSVVHHLRIKWGEGLVGDVAVSRRILATAEALDHPAYSNRTESREGVLNSFLGVPIVRSGKALGVVSVENRAARSYTEEETEVLQYVSTLLSEMAASLLAASPHRWIRVADYQELFGRLDNALDEIEKNLINDHNKQDYDFDQKKHLLLTINIVRAQIERGWVGVDELLDQLLPSLKKLADLCKYLGIIGTALWVVSGEGIEVIKLLIANLYK